MASLTLPPSSPARLPYLVAAALALLVAGAVVVAQVSGDRGIAPVASSTDIEVHGIKVDVGGKNPEDARRFPIRSSKASCRRSWSSRNGSARAATLPRSA
jgi:hypothetical protein